MAEISDRPSPSQEGSLSAEEARFDRARRRLGLWLGPLAFALLLLFPPAGLAPAAARLAAVVAWVLVWWITEAVPLPATAILGPALAVVLGVVPAREAFAPFGDPIIFLFLGSFLLARAMTAHGLDRRLARAVLALPAASSSPARVVATFAALAAALAILALRLRRQGFHAPGAGPAGPAPGPMSAGERSVTLAFLATVTLWVGPGILALLLGNEHPVAAALARALPEGVVAVLGAALLFLLPAGGAERRRALTWGEATQIDWGTLLLFGGGLSLGGAMFRTGLSEAVGQGLVAATGVSTTAGLTVVFAVFAIFFTEVTSNTAAATMLVPLAIAAAEAAGASPLEPALACALGCSMAFMLPVATPPNAIVYGSGRVPLPAMVRAGFLLNLAACVLLPAGVLLLAPLVFR